MVNLMKLAEIYVLDVYIMKDCITLDLIRRPMCLGLAWGKTKAPSCDWFFNVDTDVLFIDILFPT